MLVLVGRVLTGDPARPRAEAVAMRGDRIVAVGSKADVLRGAGRNARVIGESGCAILPGFVDAHVHFVALARRGDEVDCSPRNARSVAEILERIREAASARPPDVWIRAFGFDEALLAERRAPTSAELDRVAPRNPVRLLHRTGHAAVLNSSAFRAVGLERRDVVLEPGELLRGKIPKPDSGKLKQQAAGASRRMLAAGVTSFHDVTPGQDSAAVETLRDWTVDGTIRQRVATYGDPKSFAPQATKRFVAAGVKLMVGEDADVDELAARIADADRAGARVALHAVEGGPLVVAIAALARLGAARVRALRHRIEHASLCPPPLRGELAASGATVVTHPLFLARFGRKYRAEIAPEQFESLYPLRGFIDAGIPVALGSDAPIAPSEPLANVRAAVLREDEDGRPFEESQRVSVVEALAMHTASVESGDVVVLDADPTEVDPHEIAKIGVRATIVGGEVAWER